MPKKKKPSRNRKAKKINAERKITDTRVGSEKKTKAIPKAVEGFPEKEKKTADDKARIKAEKRRLLEISEKKELELREKILLEKSSHSQLTYYQRRYGKYVKRARGPFFIVLKILFFLFLVAALGVFVIWAMFGQDLPDVSQLKKMTFAQTTRIYDRDGNILYSIYDNENRQYVTLDEIAKNAIYATLSIEDKNFYRHFGFDILGMVRAQMKNLQDDRISQGASTITQQLAKNIFLSPERTYSRKIKELLLAVEIEILYSKDDILEMYLNKIAYGSNAFGIEAASMTFFDKSAKELDLVESSVLASLPKAPTTYSPYGQNKKELLGYCNDNTVGIYDLDNGTQMISSQELVDFEAPLAEDASGVANVTSDTRTSAGSQEDSTQEVKKVECTSPFDKNYVWGRKDYVLQRMMEDGYITKDQFIEAWKEGLTLRFRDPLHKIEAPHFVFYVKEYLEQKYGKELVESGGLEIITSLDPHLQSLAEESVARHAEYNWNNFRANNAGLVALDPRTGQILAMVGSVNYWDEKIDGQVNTTTSPRQPGSSFKPIIYSAAIQNAGIGSGTVLSDYKTIFNKNDIPRNADNTYKGKMIVRTALAQSRNIPAIKAYYIAGEEEKILDFADRLGLTGLRQFRDNFNKEAAVRGWTFFYGWPMAIGSGEVKLLDLASAYGALADNGMHMQLNPILEVRNSKGEVLEKFTPQGEQAIDPQAAYIVTDILADASSKPAGSWRNAMTIAGHTVAAKTGTSNKKIGRAIYPNNNILMGYTPSMVVGVWVGNTDGSAMRGNAWGFADAGPIWKYFFGEALKDKPDEKFTEPEGIIHKGRELFPSWVKYKNWDDQFKKFTQEDTQQNSVSVAPMDIPVSDFLSKPTKPDAVDTPVTTTPDPTPPTDVPGTITPDLPSIPVNNLTPGGDLIPPANTPAVPNGF